jgi:dolichol kinase
VSCLAPAVCCCVLSPPTAPGQGCCPVFLFGPSAVQEFVDERDSGAIYVTHFTLLLGLAVPMWLIASALPGDDASSTLRAVVGGLSGVVIVGVGDTAASLVGKLFGRRPVHAGSRKTLEGMVAGVVGSLVAWVALIEGVGLSSDVHLWQLMQWWGQLVAATAGAGLMEACTSQLDNVLLPLWYLPHLLLVSP